MILRSLITDAALASKHSAIDSVVHSDTKKDKLVLETSFSERREIYARLVRQLFASKQSVFIICPSTEEVEQLERILAKGIEHRTYALTSELSVKQYQMRWLKAATQTEPVVVIGTYTILSIPRNDMGLIILERESARGYALPSKPYVQVRDAVVAFAESARVEIILGDDLLTIDTQWAIERGEYHRFEDRDRRDSVSARIRTIDLQKLEKIDKITPAFSRPMLETIDAKILSGERVFIYTARKGFGTALLCGDCGESVICPVCSSSMKVIEKKKQRLLTCPFCRHTETALVGCKHCGSWKLTTLGITTEQVASDLRTIRPQLRTHLLDTESAKSHTQAKRIRDTWRERGGILIGTEMALPYVRGLADLVCIASLDALFALPDWKAHERASHLIFLLAQSTSRLLIQTRHTANDVVERIASGDIATVIASELAMRKRFGYPPYRSLITIKIQGTPERVRSEMTRIKKTMSEWVVDEHITPKPRGTQLFTLVLNAPLPIPETLHAALYSLPPYIAVSTHPDSTL
jgi:primosomal protein N' (replication factor Y)